MKMKKAGRIKERATATKVAAHREYDINDATHSSLTRNDQRSYTYLPLTHSDL